MNANYDSSFSGWVIGGVKISMGPTESVFILANLITLRGQDQRLNCAFISIFYSAVLYSGKYFKYSTLGKNKFTSTI